MARHGKKADDLTAPAGMINVPDEDNTPEPPRDAPGARQVADSGGGIDFTPKKEGAEGDVTNEPRRSDAGGQSTGGRIQNPLPRPDAAPADRDALPPDASPADLYAEAVALHGKGSEQAARIRMEHQADAGFQAVADWIDRTGVGVLRAATAKPADASRGLRRYRVSHQDCPTHEVQADSPHEAVEEYKKWAGIIATPHRFGVEEL